MRANNNMSTAAALHRVKKARETAGVSIRSMARRMQKTPTELKDLEHHDDLHLSELYQCQKALQVPISELLDEPEAPLSEPIRQRACLVRVAKTANSLFRSLDKVESQRLGRVLLDQLEELMPELRDIGGWPEAGQPRTADELGRAAHAVSFPSVLSDCGDLETAE